VAQLTDHSDIQSFGWGLQLYFQTTNPPPLSEKSTDIMPVPNILIKDIISYGGSLKKVPRSLSIIVLRIICFTICEGQAFLNGTQTRYSLRGSVEYPVQSRGAPVLPMSRLTHLFLGTLTN